MNKKQFSFSLVDLFFFLSAVSIFLIGNSPQLGWSDKEVSLSYMIFNIIYGVLVYVCRHQFKDFKSPNLITFVFSFILIFMSFPILENDQYRYLWEGRVLMGGKSLP